LFALLPDRPKDDVGLFVANHLLIDDAVGDPAPHPLASGMCYGLMFPTTKRCIVTTLPWLADDADAAIVRPAAFAAIDREQRLIMIAYAVAHEIGTHIAMKLLDSYASDSGHSRPILAVRDPRELWTYATWPKFAPAREPQKLDDRLFRGGVFHWRIQAAIARKDRDAALAAFEAAQWDSLPPEALLELATSIKNANWN
jgi:hypothetical protein